MNLKNLDKMTSGLSITSKMPVLFLGHGSPMNAIEENEFVKIIGEVKEPDMHEVYDPVWDMEIKQFEKTATFIYTLVYTGSLPYSLNGTIDYMACDSGKCINLNESFQIEIK